MSDPDTIYRQPPAAVLPVGTSASPETKIELSPIIGIRMAGPHGSELLVKHAGQQIVAPLSWGH